MNWFPVFLFFLKIKEPQMNWQINAITVIGLREVANVISHTCTHSNQITDSLADSLNIKWVFRLLNHVYCLFCLETSETTASSWYSLAVCITSGTHIFMYISLFLYFWSVFTVHRHLMINFPYGKQRETSSVLIQYERRATWGPITRGRPRVEKSSVTALTHAEKS